MFWADSGTKFEEHVEPKILGTAGLWPLIAFIFGALATALPILNHLYLPLIDLPNHIARLYITAAPPDGPLSTYYSSSKEFVPNSAADLIWRALRFPGDPARFSQILLATYAVNFIAATMVLSRVVHGRWSVWPAAAALVVYSAPFFWGFQNFIFALPFCLYGLALWLWLEDRRWRVHRMAVFVPLALMLYLMHLFAFAILAIAVFGRELQRGLSEGRSLPRLGLLLAIELLPFGIPVLWLALTLMSGQDTPGASRIGFGSPEVLFWAIVSPLAAPGNLGFSDFNALSLAGFALLIACLSRMFFDRGTQLLLDPRMKGPVIALAVAAVLAPLCLNGVLFVHIRVPVVLVVLLIAGTSWRGMPVRQGALLALIFAALIGGRGAAFDRTAAVYEAEIADLAATTETLPAGARVLPLRAAGLQGDRRFFHLQGLLVSMRKAFVPTLFQGVHMLQVRERWADHAEPLQSSIDVRWLFTPLSKMESHPNFVEGWERKFTHALLLDRTNTDALDDPRLMRLTGVGRFTLFEIHPRPEILASSNP